MLKGFAELDAALSTGSLHVSWLPDHLAPPLLSLPFRMLPPSKAGPLSFSTVPEVPHKVGPFWVILQQELHLLCPRS